MEAKQAETVVISDRAALRARLLQAENEKMEESI